MKKLEPFQERGADFLARNFHALLADQPGLGKTVQAISAANRINARRVLVVCPASVRSSWKAHIKEWSTGLGNSHWTVMSYEQATRVGGVSPERFDVLILDEGHYLKTPTSQRTQAIFGNKAGIARFCKYIWVLTGTPVLNRPRELWPILKCLNPAFKDMTFATFAMRYCGAYWDGFGLNTKGASHLNELSTLLNGFMLRRTKREVFPNRREPDVQLVPLEVPDKDLAAVWEEEQSILNREALLSPAAEDFAALGDLSRLLRLTGEAKVPAATAYLTDLLESGVDKVVVFFHHREVGRKLFDALASCGMKPAIYQGGLSDAQKAEQVAKFQTPDCRVFLGQIQAAGTGINGLQSVCSDAVFAELDWTPGTMKQAIDRLDRMGACGEYVTARLLHVSGTLESAVLNTLGGKARVIGSLLREATGSEFL